MILIHSGRRFRDSYDRKQMRNLIVRCPWRSVVEQTRHVCCTTRAQRKFGQRRDLLRSSHHPIPRMFVNACYCSWPVILSLRCNFSIYHSQSASICARPIDCISDDVNNTDIPFGKITLLYEYFAFTTFLSKVYVRRK